MIDSGLVSSLFSFTEEIQDILVNQNMTWLFYRYNLVKLSGFNFFNVDRYSSVSSGMSEKSIFLSFIRKLFLLFWCISCGYYPCTTLSVCGNNQYDAHFSGSLPRVMYLCASPVEWFPSKNSSLFWSLKIPVVSWNEIPCLWILMIFLQHPVQTSHHHSFLLSFLLHK